ncbi:MAG: DUF4364 family protein [Clostridia bacterium]
MKVGVILSNEFEIFDNKLIVLYIIQNAKKPLTIDEIVKFCEEFGDITYFDITLYIGELKNNEYIKEIYENSIVLYDITSIGISILKELLELIPGVNLYNLKKSVNRNMVEIKTDYSVDTSVIPIKTDEFKVSCCIKEGNDELVNITLYAGTKEQVKKISKNWHEDHEAIYTKILELMTKD